MTRKTIGNALLLIFALTLSLLVLELGARLLLFGGLGAPRLVHEKLLNDPHPQRGWTLKPNEQALSHTLDFVSVTHTNSRGLNDAETSYAKPEGVFRIVVLGDSFMFGREVPREKGLPFLLEQALAQHKVEVVNLGVIGYGTIQEYLYLMEEGFKYEPDLVLLGAYFLNDVRDNFQPLNQKMWGENTLLSWGRPYADWDEAKQELTLRYPPEERLAEYNTLRANRLVEQYGAQPWWDRTAAGMLISHVLSQALQRATGPKFDSKMMFGAYATMGLDPETSAQWEQAWKVTAGSILQMHHACEERGTRLMVMTIPDRFQVDVDYWDKVRRQLEGTQIDRELVEKRVEELGREHDFPVLNLIPPFRRALERGSPPLHFQLEDPHWTAAGHALATEALAQFLLEQGLLKAAPQSLAE